MRSAVYYPHTELSTWHIAGERLLKRALLLWDQLEFIVPDPGYKAQYGDPKIAEAIEIIGVNHFPSEDEKKQAHLRIEDLVTRPKLPEVFLYRGTDPYEIYPQKFLPDTWNVLMESKLAGALLPNSDYPMSSQAGLTVMGILADCCAGATRSRVTDRAQAYAGLAGLLGEQDSESSARDKLVDGTLRLLRRKEALVSLRLSMIDVDAITLDQLVAFRKREATETGHSVRDLRHRYVERVETQVKKLANHSMTESDVKELQRQFDEENADDLRQLKEELRAEWVQAVFSKDVIITFLAATGSLAGFVYPPANAIAGVMTAAGAPVTLGGILSARSKLLKARSDVLRKHPMAFLYELGK